ncbi:MAG: DNA repair protein RecN, partial [Acidobacteriota bacterium]|nr:DNA repair protein RecN [Acidobacteriota bacterium]
GALSRARAAAAARLGSQAAAQINDLAMAVRFEVGVTPEEGAESGWTVHGWDRIEYRLATNAGEPLKPLDEIASGGEMSRVMLALKVTVEESFAAAAGGAPGGGKRRGKGSSAARAELPAPRMLVFDEIDIGIGGRAAEAVGRKLKALSRRQQVVCITHLPQIAAFADQHFLIEKAERGGRTRTSIRRMDDSERAQEIARMLSGATVTGSSLEHARQLLAMSR